MVTKNKNIVKNEIYALPNEPSPARPVIFDPEYCNGCNVCVEVCVQDVLIPNPEKGKPPIILYPDECYYDGNCVLHCKRKPL
ncbi:MAG: ferredoxin family protein [Chloroflexi bacterium]|nr:ferredoxin family protein [Chloroflexota bacterium]